MNWFKFNWFGSKEREELQRLREENKTLQAEKEFLQSDNKVFRDAAYEVMAEQKPLQQKPYKNILYNSTSEYITVIMNDGNVFSKGEVDASFFERVKSATTESDIISLFVDKTPIAVESFETKEEKALVTDNLDALREHDDFVIIGSDVYLKGVSLAMPAIVVASFIEIVEKVAALGSRVDDSNFLIDGKDLEEVSKQYISLKMFWLKLATSPRQESREQVLTFCKKNDIRLSKTGNIIAYRRVVTWKKEHLESNKQINKFVKEQYETIKARKKGPGNYNVVISTTGGLEIQKIWEFSGGRRVGNLKHIYNTPLNEEGEQLYTSQHNKGKYTFKIGDVYKADEGDIELDANVCHAGGLHAANVNYSYSGYGDTKVVVLINPSKTITVPQNDIGKLRTVEMKIACINPNETGVHIEESLIAEADSSYNQFTIEQLEEDLKNKSFNNISIQEEVPSISLVDLKEITNQLKERVQEVK